MLYLASQSPRRRELLTRLGLDFGVLEVDVPEQRQPGEPPLDYVNRVAREKAGAGLAAGDGGARCRRAGRRHRSDAGRRRLRQAGRCRRRGAMLRELSGRTHRVITAVWLVSAGREEHAILRIRGALRAVGREPTSQATSPAANGRARPGATPSRAVPPPSSSTCQAVTPGVMGLPLHETSQLLREIRAATCEREANVRRNPDQRHPARDPRRRWSKTACCRNCTSSAATRRGVVGNIYKGRVQRVMPGMQAAFVDIGLDRAAFLHAIDILRAAAGAARAGRTGRGSRLPRPRRSPPSVAADHRTGARGPGNRGAGGQGSDRQQGRAPDHADFAFRRATWCCCRIRA